MQSLTTTGQRVDLSLADGNPLVLSAMSEVFEKDPRFSLVATAATAEGFLATIMRIPVHVGVIDWQIPALGGQKLIEVLRDHESAPRIVVYGDDTTIDLPRHAMLAGAAGFVGRNAPVETLLDTCASVAMGQMVFPFLDVRELQNDPINALTKRERALLEALAQGLSNRELARDFQISTNTVKFHMSNLYEKLGLRNRAQAIAFYYAEREKAGRR
jgi:two-component system, NarL family, nitrate/nitrite response regulator NarP